MPNERAAALVNYINRVPVRPGTAAIMRAPQRGYTMATPRRSRYPVFMGDATGLPEGIAAMVDGFGLQERAHYVVAHNDDGSVTVGITPAGATVIHGRIEKTVRHRIALTSAAGVLRSYAPRFENEVLRNAANLDADTLDSMAGEMDQAIGYAQEVFDRLLRQKSIPGLSGMPAVGWAIIAFIETHPVVVVLGVIAAGIAWYWFKPSQAEAKIQRAIDEGLALINKHDQEVKAGRMTPAAESLYREALDKVRQNIRDAGVDCGFTCMVQRVFTLGFFGVAAYALSSLLGTRHRPEWRYAWSMGKPMGWEYDVPGVPSPPLAKATGWEYDAPFVPLKRGPGGKFLKRP